MSKRKKLLPWFTFILFTLFFLMLINFNKFTYWINEDAYESVNCKVTKQTYDGLLAFFPKIDVSYTYNGEEIESSKIMYSGIFFNDKVDDNITIYVNKASPKDFLLNQSYLDSWLNWILTINMMIFVSIFSYNIVENVVRYVKIKETSKKRDKR